MVIKCLNLKKKTIYNITLNYLNFLIDKQKSSTLRSNDGANSNKNNEYKIIELNEKTKSLKKELNSIKKLQENLNYTFGDSMKNFVNQLNEKLKSFCLSEINEKIKFDLILMKYQNDSKKIEAELR